MANKIAFYITGTANNGECYLENQDDGGTKIYPTTSLPITADEIEFTLTKTARYSLYVNNNLQNGFTNRLLVVSNDGEFIEGVVEIDSNNQAKSVAKNTAFNANFASDSDMITEDPANTTKVVNPNKLGHWFATLKAAVVSLSGVWNFTNSIKTGLTTGKIVGTSTGGELVEVDRATNSEAVAGTETSDLMTPSTTKTEIDAIVGLYSQDFTDETSVVIDEDADETIRSDLGWDTNGDWYVDFHLIAEVWVLDAGVYKRKSHHSDYEVEIIPKGGWTSDRLDTITFNLAAQCSGYIIIRCSRVWAGSGA